MRWGHLNAWRDILLNIPTGNDFEGSQCVRCIMQFQQPPRPHVGGSLLFKATGTGTCVSRAHFYYSFTPTVILPYITGLRAIIAMPFNTITYVAAWLGCCLYVNGKKALQPPSFSSPATSVSFAFNKQHGNTAPNQSSPASPWCTD